MQRFKFPLTLVMIGLVFLFFESFLTSCASRASPSGGPRDTIAPVLDTAFPANFSTRFKGSSIELVFNEYLNLKSPGQQIMISPPVENKPEITLKGKRILIELQDSLLANTTYTISFGTSITDYTEGNENRNFKYVFSTGTYIDSLSVQGRVYDAYTNNPEKDLIVALYEVNSDTVDLDSLPYKKIPTYYAYLDEGGLFRMENLKSSRFMLLAFDDQRGDFKLNGGEEMAFNDSLIFTSDSVKPFVLRSFKSEPPYKFYSARHSAFGQIAFNFSKPVPDIRIDRMRKKMDPDSIYLDFNLKKDTLIYWFKEEADSMSFLVSGYEGIDDTASLFLREFQKPQLKLNVEQTELRAQDSLFLKSNIPLLSVNADSFMVFSAKDTFATQAAISNKDPFRVYLLPAKRPKDFKVKIMTGAVKGWFNAANDSADWSFSSLGRDDLGNLDFNIQGDSGTSYVLEIYDPAKKKILEKKFTGSTSIKLRGYKPGRYEAQMVVDKNEDGRWTSGDYKERKQPETILKYSEGIEIRANWDLELEWKVKPQSEIDPDPSGKKSAPLKPAQRPF